MSNDEFSATPLNPDPDPDGPDDTDPMSRHGIPTAQPGPAGTTPMSRHGTDD